MLEFKQTIEEKAYNDMRELVGWRRLDPQQAQTGLDNSIFTIVAYDANEPVGMALCAVKSADMAKQNRLTAIPASRSRPLRLRNGIMETPPET